MGRLLACSTLAVVLGLAGCGGGPESDAQAFVTAVREGDDERACALMSFDGREDLAQTASQYRLADEFAGCPKTVAAVRRNFADTASIAFSDGPTGEVETKGDRATVEVGNVALDLVRTEQGWRVQDPGLTLVGETRAFQAPAG